MLSRIKVEDLATFDLEYLFLKIRAASVGEDVTMKITCLDDNETRVDYTLDISQVKVTFLRGHDKKIKLTDNVGMIMKYPGLEEFVDLTLLGIDMDNPEKVFETVARCIEQIYEGMRYMMTATTTFKEKIQFVESLTQKQFESVRKFFTTMPVLRHEFKVTNPKTGVESSYTLEGLQSFFG